MNASSALKIALRIVLVSGLFTILGFAVGGFLGIVSISLLRAGHIGISMQDALWFGGIPGALLGMVAGFVVIAVWERRANSIKRSRAGSSSGLRPSSE